MSNHQNSTGLQMNVIPITFEKEMVLIGRLPNMGVEDYQKLRDDNWKTRAFRFDSRTGEILNVSIEPGIKPLGNIEEVKVDEHLLLLARAVQQSILVWLSQKITFIKGNKKLVFWGKADNALLLSKALKKVNLPSNPQVEVILRYEIDCRMFQYEENKNYLGLVIDFSTSNVIEIPVVDLIDLGMDICGRYVCRKVEVDQEYMQQRLELVGRVSEISGSTLFLTDTEGIDQVDASEVFIEPRNENLLDVLQLTYKNSSGKLIEALNEFRNPVSTATGKLARIRETLEGFRKKKFIIGNDISISFGELLAQNSSKFPEITTTDRPTLLFGAQGRNQGTIPDEGIQTHGPYMYMHHARNEPTIAVICEAKYRGRIEQFLEMLLTGFPADQWQNATKQNPFKSGLIGKFRILKPKIIIESCDQPTATSYKQATENLLNRLVTVPDIAIVQIRESFLHQYGNNNPYFVSKSIFMSSGIPTQSIKIEKILNFNDGTAYLLNTIALAIYAKLDGTPWLLSTIRPSSHELVVGLGSVDVGDGRLGTRTKYMGITSVFQGDGRYLIWGATREAEYENYPTALLESLRTTVTYIKQINAWQPGDRVRLIYHVYKKLKDCEVEAIKLLVKELIDDRFIVEFAFLDISTYHPYNIFDPDQSGFSYWNWEKKKSGLKGKGVPKRGFCVQLDNHRGLLQLTGPGDVKTEDQGLPRPLLVELHKDSDFTDLTYLLRQIYHFSFLSWRTFFPSPEPITITYSRLIARLLGNLKAVTGWNSNVIMYGPLKDRRWFL